jgi:hypothetical protein
MSETFRRLTLHLQVKQLEEEEALIQSDLLSKASFYGLVIILDYCHEPVEFLN